MITIKEVSSKREMRKWCDLPLRLYKNNEYFCPAFYDDEVALYDPKGTGVNKDIAISKFFYAEKDGKIVGRVAAIINTAYIKIHNTKHQTYETYSNFRSSLLCIFIGYQRSEDLGSTRALFCSERIA